MEAFTKERKSRLDGAPHRNGPDLDGQGLTQHVLDALAGIRFGSVEVVVHDGRIVQIERREKVRL